MPASLMPMPKQAFYGLVNGVMTPIVGGKVYTYEAGTTTPKDTYTTAAGNVPNANPVVLDARGEASVWLGSGAYDIVLKGADDALIWTQENVENLMSGGGSSQVGFLQAGSGAAPRTAQAKMREIVSVYDFGALGDGVTSDQTAVAAAVAHCNGIGEWLYWPDGTYLTTATIPNFHDVVHFGPGVVKRGSDLFYVTPRNGITNTLYVATTGSDSNDGLSSGQPFLTTQAAGDTIYKYAYGDATWKLQHAAGTYTQATTFSRAFPTPNRVQFMGAAVSDGTVPTTIFSKPAGTAKVGVYVNNYARIQVEDIKFTSYKDGASPSVSGNSSGITGSNCCDIYTRNIHVDDCDTGIECAVGGLLRVQAGIVNGCAYGIMPIFGTTYTIGYNGTAADAAGATGTAITNCTGSAILAQEGATGHADYCYISGSSTGVSAQSRSRCHVLGSTLTGNTKAVEVSACSSWYNNPVTPNTFSSNTDDWIHYGYSVEEATESALRAPGLFLIRDTTTYGTSSTSAVTAISKSIPANTIRARGAGLRIRLWGTVVGTAGTKTIAVTFGGTTLISKTIAAATTSWSCDVEFITRTGSGSPQQKCFTIFIEDGVAPDTAINTSIALDLSAAQTLEINHLVANAADTSRIQHIDMQVIH